MDLRRFRVGDLPVVQELSVRGIIHRHSRRSGRTGPGASPPGVCRTATPWRQRRRGICWALEIWSRADIWSACIRQRTASAGLFHTKQTHKNSPDGGN